MKKKRVLFVCLGNICRSPTAEAVFNSMLQQRGLADQIETDSAGTAAYHVGEQADARSQEHGKKRGYQFESLARQFKDSDFKDFDIILAMDDSNFKNMARLSSSKEELKRLHRMVDFCKTHQVSEVPDPYYEGSTGFEKVLDILEDACENLLQKIESGKL